MKTQKKITLVLSLAFFYSLFAVLPIQTKYIVLDYLTFASILPHQPAAIPTQPLQENYSLSIEREDLYLDSIQDKTLLLDWTPAEQRIFEQESAEALFEASDAPDQIITFYHEQLHSDLIIGTREKKIEIQAIFESRMSYDIRSKDHPVALREEFGVFSGEIRLIPSDSRDNRFLSQWFVKLLIDGEMPIELGMELTLFSDNIEDAVTPLLIDEFTQKLISKLNDQLNVNQDNFPPGFGEAFPEHCQNYLKKLFEASPEIISKMIREFEQRIL